MFDKNKLLNHLHTLSFKELHLKANTLKTMRKLALEEKNDDKLETIDSMLLCVSEAMLAKFR
jgi:hypothetical protein